MAVAAVMANALAAVGLLVVWNVVQKECETGTDLSGPGYVASIALSGVLAGVALVPWSVLRSAPESRGAGTFAVILLLLGGLLLALMVGLWIDSATEEYRTCFSVF